MNKTIAWCIYICSISVWILLTFIKPWVLSDQNIFLKGFVNHELLSFLGLIVAITIWSVANIHLELNKLEEQVKKAVFTKTRNSIKKSIYWMIGILIASLVIVLAKPVFVAISKTQSTESFFNGAGLLAILFNILVLIDILQTTFKIKPNYES
jgi:hypothetical protein